MHQVNPFGSAYSVRIPAVSSWASQRHHFAAEYHCGEVANNPLFIAVHSNGHGIILSARIWPQISHLSSLILTWARHFLKVAQTSDYCGGNRPTQTWVNVNDT
jgi:hypothetical protein